MDLTRVQISPKTANHVLHHFGEGGYAPGSFIRLLIQALAAADAYNFALLAEVYPDYAKAIHSVKSTQGGVNRLKLVAGREPSPAIVRGGQR